MPPDGSSLGPRCCILNIPKYRLAPSWILAAPFGRMPGNPDQAVRIEFADVCDAEHRHIAVDFGVQQADGVRHPSGASDCRGVAEWSADEHELRAERQRLE